MVRVIKGCKILPLVEDLAREAGVACAKSRTSDVVDAIVVVTAKRLGGTTLIVTSDPKDLSRIANAIDAHVHIHRV